jgi:hypothetical protein
MRFAPRDRVVRACEGGGHRGSTVFRRRLVAAACVAIPLLSLGAQASASPRTKLALLAAHSEGGGYFDVIAKDAPGTRLVLYVDGSPEGRAKANARGRVAFAEVLLTGAGKLSFSAVLKGQNGQSHQRPTGYVRYYSASEESVQFSRAIPEPPVVPLPEPTPPPPSVAPPAPPPTPSPAPVCTSGTYVNSAGNTVCSPEPGGPTAPAGATARCADGTYSFSESRSGTCSHHGGVAEWL